MKGHFTSKKSFQRDCPLTIRHCDIKIWQENVAQYKVRDLVKLLLKGLAAKSIFNHTVYPPQWKPKTCHRSSRISHYSNRGSHLTHLNFTLKYICFDGKNYPHIFIPVYLLTALSSLCSVFGRHKTSTSSIQQQTLNVTIKRLNRSHQFSNSTCSSLICSNAWLNENVLI